MNGFRRIGKEIDGTPHRGKTKRENRRAASRNSAMMAGIGERRTGKASMSQYDELEDDPGPVVVRRPVYEAGIKLEAEEAAGSGWKSFDAAEAKMDECKAAGKTDEAAFWKEVYDFCMTRESVAADTEVIILEKGESYNWNVGKVERKS